MFVDKISYLKKGIVLLCILSFGILSHAQGYTIKGVVTEEKTSEPISSCNVVIDGSGQGAVTDQSGFFSLEVKREDIGKKLIFSFVGYDRLSYPISSLLGASVYSFKMKESKTQLQTVEISANAMIEQHYIRKAVENIGKNYIQRDFIYSGAYTSQIKGEYGADVSLSASVRIDDVEGYKDCSPLGAYEKVFYAFSDLTTDNKSKKISFEMSESYMDALLSCDIVRNGMMVLDLASLNQFTLATEEETDESFTIIYEADKPSFIMAQDFGAAKITGRIVISKSDYAVLKNEFWISTNTDDLKRRTLNPAKMVVTHEYYGSVTYKKSSLGYAPSSFTFKTDKENADLNIRDYSGDTAERLKSRQYYMGTKSFLSY